MQRSIVAALGDSITAGSPGWDPDPAVRAGMPEPNPESRKELDLGVVIADVLPWNNGHPRARLRSAA